MTTTEAAKIAFEMRDRGVSCRKIAKHLARSGYVSFKTGRALSEAGVSLLATQHRQGYKFKDIKRRKYADAHMRYRPRTTTSTATAPTSTGIEAIKNSHINQVVSPEAKEFAARATLKRAMERVIERLFDMKVTVLLPIDKVVLPANT